MAHRHGLAGGRGAGHTCEGLCGWWDGERGKAGGCAVRQGKSFRLLMPLAMLCCAAAAVDTAWGGSAAALCHLTGTHPPTRYFNSPHTYPTLLQLSTHILNNTRLHTEAAPAAATLTLHMHTQQHTLTHRGCPRCRGAHPARGKCGAPQPAGCGRGVRWGGGRVAGVGQAQAGQPVAVRRCRWGTGGCNYTKYL